MKKSTIIALAATAAAMQAAGQSADGNIFRYRVGDAEIVLLSDGQGEGDTRVLLDAPAETTAPYLSEKGTYATATNAFAVISGGKVTLIDAGTGAALQANLAAAGIERIDAIYLTHMHGDHIGGLLKDDARTFDGVPLYLSGVEAGYWRQQGGNASKVLDLYEPETLKPVELETAAAPGNSILAIQAYGHTPGHTAFLVASRGERLLVWGDLTHAMAVQMPRPEISVRYDVDPDAARASRLRILEYAAAHKIPVAGMHIPYPGIGTVEKTAEGYKFTPVKH